MTWLVLLCQPKAGVDVLGTMSRHSQQALKLDDITKQRTDISLKCDAACPSEWRRCVKLMNQSHGVLFWFLVTLVRALEFLCATQANMSRRSSFRLLMGVPEMPRHAELRQTKIIFSHRLVYFSFSFTYFFFQLCIFLQFLFRLSFYSLFFFNLFPSTFCSFHPYSSPFRFLLIIPLLIFSIFYFCCFYSPLMSSRPIKSS
jgi:hypothetical protein